MIVAYPDIVASMTPAERRRWRERGELEVEASQVRAAMRVWLEQFGWTWYATLTARNLDSLDAGRRHFRYWRNSVNRKAWGSNYANRPHEGIWGASFWERQVRGDWHVHALISGTNGLEPSVAQRLWDRVMTLHDPLTGTRIQYVTRLGQVEHFVPNGNAVGYCVKQQGAGATFDIFGPWPAGGHTRDVR